MEISELVARVTQAQAGDRAAFGELVTHFQSSVFAVALRRLRNRTEAAELAQDVFMQAYRKQNAPEYKMNSSMKRVELFAQPSLSGWALINRTCALSRI